MRAVQCIRTVDFNQISIRLTFCMFKCRSLFNFLCHVLRYLHCSPTTNHLMHEENALFRSFTSMIRSFLPKKTPKIAMFGPGLESGTLKIVPLIINNTDMLKTVGVAPGEFTGNNNFSTCLSILFIIFFKFSLQVIKASCKFMV